MTTKEPSATATKYAAYLQSSHWRELRARAVAVHGDQCACCARKPIQMHHLRYGSWYDVTPEDLIPLCHRCHEAAHAGHLKKLINSNTGSGWKRHQVVATLRNRFCQKASVPRKPMPPAPKEVAPLKKPDPLTSRCMGWPELRKLVCRKYGFCKRRAQEIPDDVVMELAERDEATLSSKARQHLKWARVPFVDKREEKMRAMCEKLIALGHEHEEQRVQEATEELDARLCRLVGAAP